MIVNPERYVQKFAELGSEILTVHLKPPPIYTEQSKILKIMG